MHMLATLAPMADRVLVMCVPGNHDEVRRDRITSSRDSWAIEAISAVQDALEVSGDYAHITCVYPGEDELSVAVDIDGLVVDATHGHVVSSPDRIPAWLVGQALGKQPVGEADILVSGHWHHLIVKNIGAGRTWFQCPAMDNGSALPQQEGRRGAVRDDLGRADARRDARLAGAGTAHLSGSPILAATGRVHHHGQYEHRHDQDREYGEQVSFPSRRA
jgi:predicted phosphodiesterase